MKAFMSSEAEKGVLHCLSGSDRGRRFTGRQYTKYAATPGRCEGTWGESAR